MHLSAAAAVVDADAEAMDVRPETLGIFLATLRYSPLVFLLLPVTFQSTLFAMQQKTVLSGQMCICGFIMSV